MIMAMLLIEKYNEAQKLLLGHIDRWKTRQALDAEYQMCHNQEHKWARNVPETFRCIRLLNACWIVNEVCKALCYKPPKEIVVNSKEARIRKVGAQFSPKEKSLQFYYDTIEIGQLIHELTHYVMFKDKGKSGLYYSHGEDFCEIEKILMETADLIFARNN